MFRRQFQFKQTNASNAVYNIGDIVINQGRAYECKKITSSTPLQDEKSWRFTGLLETFKGTNPPVKPVANQLWLSDSGTLYIWYGDQDGFQWVQI